MDSIKQFFTQKVGPLPTWAWGGIAAGIIVVGILVYRNRSSGTTQANNSTTANTTSQAAVTGVTNVPVLGEVSGLPASTVTTPATSPPATVPLFTVNDTGNKYAGHPSQAPLYGQKDKPGSPGSGLVWVSAGDSFQIKGGVTPFGIPVDYLGVQLLADPGDGTVTSGPAPAASGLGGGGQGSGHGHGKMLGQNHAQAGRRRTHRAALHETAQ